MAATVSAVVITKNEERIIASCLERLWWADELLVVDSFSSDKTVDIARAAGAQIYQRPFVSFPHQRNVALALAQCEWVFFVDADEWFTPELAGEVRSLTETKGVASSIAGYWVPRRNLIWGRWIRHGGWYPDYQLRLLRRGRARYDEERAVHELVKLDGDAAHLRATLVHHNYRGIGQFVAKQRQYSTLEARSMFNAGIRPRARNFVLQPLREAYRRYIGLSGYRDGLHGLLLALLLGYYNLVTYVKLRRMWRGFATGR